MVNVYKNDFEKFLSYTDEKQVLLDAITDDIKSINATSLLDIGAGNGLLSIPLSKKVSRYVAVEKREELVLGLRKAGLEVIEGTFPVYVERQFDMVLSSHSIPHHKSSFEPFVKEAWKLVKLGGVFLIISYTRESADWSELLQKLDFTVDDNEVGHNIASELLKSLGKVETRKVVAKVTTENSDDMVEALSFVASDGNMETKKKFLRKKELLKEIIESSYKEEKGYAFPLQNFFVSTHKSH